MVYRLFRREETLVHQGQRRRALMHAVEHAAHNGWRTLLVLDTRQGDSAKQLKGHQQSLSQKQLSARRRPAGPLLDRCASVFRYRWSTSPTRWQGRRRD